MYATREEWLNAAAEQELRPLLNEQEQDYTLVRISVGWPRGRRGGHGAHACGECWPMALSTDGTNEIFISPEIDDPFEVLPLLMHFLIHAALDDGIGHQGEFRKVGLAVGLEGSMESATPSTFFAGLCKGMIARLGEYPHSALNDSQRVKQATRLLKCYCPSCGYTARVTRKWVDLGLPTCVCGDHWVCDA